MTTITSDHIAALHDVFATMRLASQILSEGEVDDQTAGDMSWLLTSAKKRLDEVYLVVERIQAAQERKPS